MFSRLNLVVKAEILSHHLAAGSSIFWLFSCGIYLISNITTLVWQSQVFRATSGTSSWIKWWGYLLCLPPCMLSKKDTEHFVNGLVAIDDSVPVCCVIADRILYPGGGVSIISSGYERAAKIFYELAIEVKVWNARFWCVDAGLCR